MTTDAKRTEVNVDNKLTLEQMVDMKLREAAKKISVKKVRSKKDIEDFFDEEK
ncbi:hypothetical protein [uncultured Lactobacillus sp.]|uniref:hypothetical protein n=1 Tax=uncultured Lactobacillus sp. TaxID=153152 RepID=UPI00280400ED|nr:hypothetical protein [uncultured Lactobacillus sp.]